LLTTVKIIYKKGEHRHVPEFSFFIVWGGRIG
jgi:hypothetical protein